MNSSSHLLSKWLLRTQTIIVAFLLLNSCTKDNGVFTIVGKWGVVSSTMTFPDGSVQRFPEFKDSYYEVVELKADGTIIRTTEPSKETSYGDYVFNEPAKTLQYKFDGNIRYMNATVNVNSPKDITVTTDYGPSIGRTIFHAAKIK